MMICDLPIKVFICVFLCSPSVGYVIYIYFQCDYKFAELNGAMFSYFTIYSKRYFRKEAQLPKKHNFFFRFLKISGNFLK